MPATRLPDEVTLLLDLDEPDDEAELRRRAALQLGVKTVELPVVEVVKRAIDARGRRVRERLWLRVGPAPAAPLGGAPLRECGEAQPVVIVGDGPAGRFCAYELARSGVGSVVVDRGQAVSARRRDIQALEQRGELDPDSNYCFGEGGAGTYSDGKLFTRSHKRGNVRDVMELLAVHGAPDRILTDARPHIGSDRLPAVVARMRKRLEGVGVIFRHGARVVELLLDRSGSERRVVGVRLDDGSEISARAVVLATGHSARDVYRMLQHHAVRLEPKPFAVGLRVEHPQPLIDRIQYGRFANHPRLGAASYRLATQADGRGVFTFCMCPGGFVVPASTETDGLVVNGMSRSGRDAPHANSGLVVGVTVEDLQRAGLAGAEGAVELQRRLERAAHRVGGGQQRAPATRVTDFAAGRASTTVPDSSYAPGLCAGDVREVLDVVGLGLGARLRQGLRAFDRQMRGFLTEEATLIAVESRTSAPVRVVRDPERLMADGLPGLYPCGEGAGHAGGIVSAAVDGMRVANQIVAGLK